MEKNHHVKRIKIPIYPGILILLFSEDPERMINEGIIAQENAPKEDEVGACIFGGIYKGHYTFVIVMNFWNEEMPITLDSTVHEINHCGNRILNYAEAKADFLNDEAESYLKGWIANEFQLFMQECNVTFTTTEKCSDVID